MEKKPIYDLHSHTFWSDGTLSPTEVVMRAHVNGVTTLALTDHDVTGGIAEARAVGAEVGINVVPGVEISVTWRSQTLHVLGLGIDVNHAELQEGLARLRAARHERALEIDRRLTKKNIRGAYEYICGQLRGPIISRTHFAQFLIEHGYVSDAKQAFQQYLGHGRAAGVAGKWVSLEQAIGWIRAAGGVAVLAHPGRYRVSSGGLKRLLSDFKAAGGAGIEVISGSQAPDEAERFARAAQEYELFGSVGSDYHGPEKPWVDLGRLPALPDGVKGVWESGAFSSWIPASARMTNHDDPSVIPAKAGIQ